MRPWVRAALLLAVAGVTASCSSGGASPGGTLEPGSGPLPAAAPAGPAESASPISPTGGPATPGTSAADLAWLRGVQELGPRLESVIARSPGAMTRQTLRSLAEQLRECTRELARLGVPSERLRSVRALVERACGQYERGADCFAAAAEARSASGVQSRLDCGFTAARRGDAPLAAAVARAEELRAAG